MTGVRVYWSTKGRKTLHTRSTCWRRTGEHEHSELAVLVLADMRTKGWRMCSRCSG